MSSPRSWYNQYRMAKDAQPSFTGSYFGDVNFNAAAGGGERGLLVAVLIVSGITLLVVLSAAGVWLYRSRIALADWIRGGRRGTPAPSPPAFGAPVGGVGGGGFFFPAQPSAPREP